MVMSMYAVMGVSFFADHESFKSFDVAVFSLFQASTGDGTASLVIVIVIATVIATASTGDGTASIVIVIVIAIVIATASTGDGTASLPKPATLL